MGSASTGWRHQPPDRRPEPSHDSIDTTVQLAAVAYFLIKKNHEDKLVELVNIFSQRHRDKVCRRQLPKMEKMKRKEEKFHTRENHR